MLLALELLSQGGSATVDAAANPSAANANATSLPPRSQPRRPLHHTLPLLRPPRPLPAVHPLPADTSSSNGAGTKDAVPDAAWSSSWPGVLRFELLDAGALLSAFLMAHAVYMQQNVEALLHPTPVMLRYGAQRYGTEYQRDLYLPPATRRAAEQSQAAAGWLMWAALAFAVWQISSIARREGWRTPLCGGLSNRGPGSRSGAALAGWAPSPAPCLRSARAPSLRGAGGGADGSIFGQLGRYDRPADAAAPTPRGGGGGAAPAPRLTAAEVFDRYTLPVLAVLVEALLFLQYALHHPAASGVWSAAELPCPATSGAPTPD